MLLSCPVCLLRLVCLSRASNKNVREKGSLRHRGWLSTPRPGPFGEHGPVHPPTACSLVTDLGKKPLVKFDPSLHLMKPGVPQWNHSCLGNTRGRKQETVPLRSVCLGAERQLSSKSASCSSRGLESSSQSPGQGDSQLLTPPFWETQRPLLGSLGL